MTKPQLQMLLRQMNGDGLQQVLMICLNSDGVVWIDCSKLCKGGLEASEVCESKLTWLRLVWYKLMCQHMALYRGWQFIIGCPHWTGRKFGGTLIALVCSVDNMNNLECSCSLSMYCQSRFWEQVLQATLMS